MTNLCYNREYPNNKTAAALPTQTAASNHERDWLSMATSDSILKRFFKKVQKSEDPDGCWLWTANKLPRGYGLFWSGIKHVQAHRFAYELFVGAIPEGLYVLHDCPGGDNPSCVNPAHLWIGTQADNMQDMMHKKRSIFHTHPESIARGERHWMRRNPEKIRSGENSSRAKLTEKEVREIIHVYRNGGITYEALGQRFGVTKRTIRAIVRRENWKHLVIDDE